jgi:hypothetical protein
MDAMDWLAQWGNPPQDSRQVNDLVTHLKVVLNGFQSTFAIDDPLFAMRAATAFWSEVVIATAVQLELPSGTVAPLLVDLAQALTTYWY